MRRSTVFFDSFLDGFTLRGFLTKLNSPGAADHLFAPSEDEEAILMSDEVCELRHRLESQQREIEALKTNSSNSLLQLTREIQVLKSAVETVSKTHYGSR